MNAFQAWLRKLGALLHRRRLERDLEDELAFHLAMREADHVSAGASPAVAYAVTRRQFGNVSLVKERARDQWIPPSVQALGQDVRFACRLLAKDPRFALAVVAALSLGIAANMTAFTLVNGALFRPIPLADPDRLVAIRTVDARNRPMGVSYADVRDWRASTRSLSNVISSLDVSLNLGDENLPAERYLASLISPDAFQMVGRAPILGRTFRPDEDRQDAPRVILIAYTIWKNRYHGDPNILGRAVRINDAPATIIGVMPEHFHFPVSSEIWEPAAFGMGPPATLDARRGNRNPTTQAYGRLADGVTQQQAQSDLDAITKRLARDFPATNTGISLSLTPLDQTFRNGSFQQMLLLVMASVAFVLLIACVNVANLLLARSVHRSREIAIRSSLGATRWRIVRQLLIESLLLAAIAGVAGYFIGVWGVGVFSQVLLRTDGGPPPFWLDFSLDWRVYAFVASLCLGTAVLFGLPPALHVSRTGDGDAMKDGGRSAVGGVRASRWTSALVVMELTLTLMLLTATGLQIRGFLAVYRAGQVLDSSNLVTMRLALVAQKYRTPDQIKAFYQRLDERLVSRPLFPAVTVASDVPMMAMTGSIRQLAIDGRSPTPDETPTNVSYLYIGPRYFSTLRLHLLRGREFTAMDGAPGSETAIVNQRFASTFFPNGDPIGHRVQLSDAAAPNIPAPWFTVVGVAPTIPQYVAAVDDSDAVVYVPVRGEPAPHRFASIIVRGNGDQAATVQRLREEVRQVDPDLAGYFVRSMDEMLGDSRFPFRVFGLVFGLMATIALVLASVGLFAVTAHGVAQRTQEIGVRMALGAARRDVIWLFVRRTTVQLAAGLLIGLPAALALGRILSGVMVKTTAADPVILGVAALTVIAIALAATFLPARRAARVDPVVALRYE